MSDNDIVKVDVFFLILALVFAVTRSICAEQQ